MTMSVDEVVPSSRSKKPEMVFGDDDFTLSGIDEYQAGKWDEVCTACFKHKTQGWTNAILGVMGIFLGIFFFSLGLDLLAAGSQVLSGCKVGVLLQTEFHPFSAVMIGIIGTALLQSTTAANAIITALLTGNRLSPETAVYVVLGENVGSAISSNIVALAQIRKKKEFERAFAAAVINNLFNIFTTVVIFPIELVTGFFKWLSFKIIDEAETRREDVWEGPLSMIVKPITRSIIVSSTDRIAEVALGDECDASYPPLCDDGTPTYESCSETGFIACSKDSGKCPLFFTTKADFARDKYFGGLSIVLALVILFLGVFVICNCLQRLIKGVSPRVVYKATTINGYIAIFVGIGAGMILQSSAVTTSLLVAPIGIGALRLEEVYPFTVGGNIGIAINAVLASLISNRSDALLVATLNLLFNITGFLLWFAIPHLRSLPISIARKLGEAIRVWRYFCLAYMLVVYFSFPLICIGIGELFSDGSNGVGVVLSMVVAFAVAGVLYCFLNANLLEGSDIDSEEIMDEIEDLDDFEEDAF